MLKTRIVKKPLCLSEYGAFTLHSWQGTQTCARCGAHRPPRSSGRSHLGL